MVESHTLALSAGQIEYARLGRGTYILISHGTLGGYDQGLAIASLFDLTKHAFLSVSRAGYLRSSLESGRTPDEQADSYLALLDALEIETAAVLGVSGGAPSALRFAERCPKRCSCLVLLSAIPYAPPPLPLAFRLAIRWQDALMGHDWLLRPMATHGLSLSLRMNGVSDDQIRELKQDSRKWKALQGIFGPIATASQRREGLRNDGRQIESLPTSGSYEIAVPTFIAHGRNDPLAEVSLARRLAEDIHTDQYREYDDGGHIFFVVYSDNLFPEIEAFLEST